MFSQLEAPDWPNIPNVQIINKRVPHTAHGTKTRNAEEGQLPPCPQKLKRVSWGTENRNSRGQGFCREMQSSNPQTNAGLQQRNEILLKICTLKKKSQEEVYLALLFPDGINHTNTGSHRHISSHSLGSIVCSLPAVKIISSTTTSASEDVVKCGRLHVSPTPPNQGILWLEVCNSTVIKLRETLPVMIWKVKISNRKRTKDTNSNI